MVSPKRSIYSEEDNNYDLGYRMMYPLHYTGVKLMELKKKFGIKDTKTKHIPGSDIRNELDTDYSSFTKEHWRSMT